MSIDGIRNITATSASLSAANSGAATLRADSQAFIGGQIDNLSLSADRRIAFQQAWPAGGAVGMDAFSDKLLSNFAPDGIGEQGDLLRAVSGFAEQVSVHLHVNQLSAATDAVGPLSASLDHASGVQADISGAGDAANWLGAAADYLAGA